MTMGLNNSAQTWQRLLTKVLSNMLFKSAIVYLDDVLILSKDFADHYKHLRMLFQKFRDANLRMNGKKCHFAIDQVKYIGHILNKDGIGTDPSKTEVISSWPRPKNVKHIRSFLGLINFYKRFVVKFAQRSAPCAIFYLRMLLLNGVENKKNLFKISKRLYCHLPSYVFRTLHVPSTYTWTLR